MINQTWLRFLPSFLRTRLEGRYTLQKILGNTSWLVVDRLLRMGIGLIIGVWIARYLGPAQFGLFNYAMAFIALFSPLATLGLNEIVVRDLVRDPTCQNETIGTTIALKFIGGIVLTLVGIGTIIWLRPTDELTHWLIGIFAAGAVFQAFDAIDFWFQAQVQSQYTVIPRNLVFFVIAIVKIALIQMQAPLIAFAWVGLAEVALSAIGLVIAYQVSGQQLTRWRISLHRAKNLLKDSWSLALSSVAILIYMKIDQLMLGEMVGDRSVGIYSAATRLSEVWYFIPMAIVSSATPAIIEAKKITETLYYQRLQQLFNWMVVLSVAIALPVTFLANPIITLLFGPDYSEAGFVLSIHIWAAVFVFLGVAQGPWNITENLQEVALVKFVFGGITNVLLNLVLIPTGGPVGAAIATLVSYIIVNYLSNLCFPKMPKIFKLQTRALYLSWLFRGQ